MAEAFDSRMHILGSEFSPEDREVRDMETRIERAIEAADVARDLWISNVQVLKEKVPHNDILNDSVTLYYSVLLNAWSKKIEEAAEDGIAMREQLKTLKNLEAN